MGLGRVIFIFCLFAASQVVAAPWIGCDAPKYDFGTVVGSEKIVHEFVLWNRGKSTLEISKIKNCCGVTSSIKPMVILPGSNAVCRAVFTTRNRYGKQDKQILIASNDRKHPYFELKLTGTLLRPVEFKPRLVRLGVLYPDSSVSQTITVTNLLEKAVVLESVVSKVEGIEASVDGILDPVSEDHRDLGSRLQQRSWAINLSSSERLAVGKLNGMILLNFSSGTVRVPVVGTVKPIIQVVPEEIDFSSQSTNSIERLVMLRSGDGRAFEVLSAKLSEGSGSKENPEVGMEGFPLPLIEFEDFPVGPVGDFTMGLDIDENAHDDKQDEREQRGERDRFSEGHADSFFWKRENVF